MSHLSTCACLSDKTSYPTFFRTVPSDKFQVDALVHLMKRFEWRWVGIIYSSEEKNITGKQWIGSEAWITKADLASVFSPSNTTTMCNGTEDLRTVTNDYTDGTDFRIVNHVYKAVYSVAHALHILLQCKNSSNPITGKHCINKNNVQSRNVVEHMRLVNFTTPNGDKVFFDENGDSGAKYDLVNWQMRDDGSVDIVNIGQYDSSLPEPCPPGTRKAINKNKPVCCFDCFQCPEGTISNITNSPDCLICPPEFWPNERKDKCLPKPTEYLSYKEVMGTLLTIFSCVGAFLSLATSIIFLTHKAFRATLPGSNVMKWFGPLQQRLSVLAFTLIQVLICILWLCTKPPFPKKNMQYYKETIILECALGSAVGFWAVLGYIGLLALMCFILAFLARKLPDNFNEAKLITFSMLIFCAVWIMFIPAYVSSPGKFTVAVEIFAILASSFGLLICIFVPKCYIIIFKPEHNSKKHLMGKMPS
ncbi:hypothetical protein LDENG_00195630 [Lucifuga dentata]|nr:hypothetical protein LDENG_00195630 [Lucifuga dentata]